MSQDIPYTSLLDQLPHLSGTLSTDETARTQIADDFGHRIHHRPWGILTPETFEDVVQIVQFARLHHLEVAPRGCGHSTNGQAQVKDGIVIDMIGLNTILAIHEDRVEVETGALWSTLLRATLQRGLALPVVPNYLNLTIGGVLAVGGMGPSSYRYGAITDSVLELQVVTGEGMLVTCSPTEQADLFETILGGLGQCGIIVKATLRLIPAKTHVRTFRLSYPNVDSLVHDEMLLVENKRFDAVAGNIVPTPQGTWAYMLEAASFYTPSVDELDHTQLLDGLTFVQGKEQIGDVGYFDYVHRVAQLEAFLSSQGIWQRPHPSGGYQIPTARLAQFVHEALEVLTPADLGPFPIALTGFEHGHGNAPLFPALKDDPCFFLTFVRTVPPEQEQIERAAAANYTLFERCRALGGKHYSLGTVDLSPEDWKEHFGTQWKNFSRAKRQFDPDNVLTPGQKIFF